jgi:alkylhydroperoxidase family enzyme
MSPPGVHMTTYAEAAGLTPRQVALTATGTPDHPAWSDLREHLDEPEALEFLVLAGWYRTIAYVANGTAIEPEPWAPGVRPGGCGRL